MSDRNSKIIIPAACITQPPLIGVTNQLFVAIASLSIGGAEKIVLDWASRIDSKWQVNLFVLYSRPPEREWPVPSRINVIRLQDPTHIPQFPEYGGNGNLRRLAQLKHLGKWISKSDNPVIVCHLLNKWERGALAEGGAKVVSVLHNAKVGWGEETEDLTGSTNVIAVSGACADELKASGWKGPVSIIRHIPPCRKFSPDIRKQFREKFRLPQDAKVIGMIGAVKAQKNYVLAMQVLKEMLQRQDVYLCIVGGPVNTKGGRTAWETVIEEAKRLGVRNRLCMPGFIADAAALLPAFDVVLNTSHFEGLSIATLEVLSSGLPTVASKVGGQGEISSDGLILVPADASLPEWADALEKALLMKPEPPSWATFPSFKLWTLTGLVRPIEQSRGILFVTANLNAGGAQRSLVNLAKQLNGRMPFAVAVASNSTSSYFYESLAREGICVERSADSFDAFANAEAIVHKVCKEQYGTVCFWNLDARLKLLVVKALEHSGVKFIDVSPGCNSFDEMERLRKADVWADFEDRIAFTAEQYYRRLDKMVLKYKGETPKLCAGKTVVIPNGVYAGVRKSRYSVKGNPRIVVSGRITPNKFPIEVIKAVRLVRRQIPGTELHFYGGAEAGHAEYAERVLDTAGDANGDWVQFHGLNFEVADELPNFDAFALLSVEQGCPNACLEALAAGLPVVANDNGGTREQIVNNQTGILVPDLSPEALAAGLVQVLQNRSLARQFGQRGRTAVLRKFSMQKMAEAYLDLFGYAQKHVRRSRKAMAVAA